MLESSFGRLINRPQVLFLDEPTAGLDPGNAKVIKDIILNQKRSGTTIFLTTHNMQVADDLCNRVAFIVDGKITLIDTPRELKLRNGEKSVRVEFRNNGLLQHGDFPLQGIGDNPQFSECLKGGNIETIHTLDATLEEVFLKPTGRSLA